LISLDRNAFVTAEARHLLQPEHEIQIDKYTFKV
jgi:hypothetical protein